jgi:hypothetical protein
LKNIFDWMKTRHPGPDTEGPDTAANPASAEGQWRHWLKKKVDPEAQDPAIRADSMGPITLFCRALIRYRNYRIATDSHSNPPCP